MPALGMQALDVDLELFLPAGGEGLAARLPASWPRVASARAGAPRLQLALERSRAGERLIDDERRVLAIAALGGSRELWLARLEQEVVAAVARRSACLWLHAGAVGWRGGALVLPGPSFAGKSTLVAALLRRGAVYLSDEWAAIDGAGRVHALPRPLRLREARPPVTGRRRAPESGSWPLLATGCLRYDRRPGALSRRLERGAALPALLTHALGPGDPGATLAAAAAVLRRPVYGGRRGEAEAFLDRWLAELAGKARHVA